MLRHPLIAVLVSVLPALVAVRAHAQYYGGLRDPGRPIAQTATGEMQDVGVDEHLGAQVPLDAALRDHTGRTVHLRDALSRGRPVILNLAYYSCPVFCDMVQDALVSSLREIPWTLGDQYDVLTLSIDPRDTPAAAARKRTRLFGTYGRVGADARGWHAWVGDEAEIQRVTRAVGFRYQWDARQSIYAHAAVVVLLTPSGKVARYLYGLDFPPNDVRLGLFEASEGRSMTTTDRILEYCYHYDPHASKYVVMATHIMQLGGALTLAVLGGTLGTLWWRELRKKRTGDASGGTRVVPSDAPKAPGPTATEEAA